MSATAKLAIDLKMFETYSGDHGPTQKLHRLVEALTWLGGTGASQIDTVWSDTRTASATPDTLDLRGSLTGANGATLNFAEIVLIVIINRATTAGYLLTVGDAASNPIASIMEAATHRLNIGPSGAGILWNPIDGYATTAGSADVLQIDPGANSIEYDIFIAGRSA